MRRAKNQRFSTLDPKTKKTRPEPAKHQTLNLEPQSVNPHLNHLPSALNPLPSTFDPKS
jgi:hypothetical protein